MITTVEARGVLCPVPIIRLARAAAELPAGSLIALLTDDPAAEHDVPAWCRLRGHQLVGSTDLSDGADEAPEQPAPSSTRATAGAPTEGPAAPEPHVPNPAPGQPRRHLIRLGPTPALGG